MRRSGFLLILPALLAAAQPVSQPMSFVTADGFTIQGTFNIPANPGRRPLVILAHQFQADRSGWQPLVADLNARGIATLALDLRGHGQSTRKGGATVAVTEDFMASREAVGFDQIPADLAQAAAWIRKQPRIDGRRLGLAGSSIGAYSVLVAAAQIHPVAVLALSPAGGWGEKPALRLARSVERARSAVMVLASEGDPDAFANAQAIQNANGVYARIVPGTQHGFAYLPDLTPEFGGWFGEYLSHHRTAPQPAQPPAPKVVPEEVK